MKPLGNEYKTAEVSGDFIALPPGGYVVRITNVIDQYAEAKPYLEIVFDIAEGEFKNYYADEWGSKNTWAHRFRAYYTPQSMGVFKGFLKAVDDSNGTSFVEMAEIGLNEMMLVGRVLGLVVGNEEYNTNTGEVRMRPDWFNCRVKTVNAIKSGKYTIPELKPLKKANNAPTGFGELRDDDIPFV